MLGRHLQLLSRPARRPKLNSMRTSEFLTELCYEEIKRTLQLIAKHGEELGRMPRRDARRKDSLIPFWPRWAGEHEIRIKLLSEFDSLPQGQHTFVVNSLNRETKEEVKEEYRVECPVEEPGV